jgi:4-carboxymuconolactone decarboxylase
MSILKPGTVLTIAIAAGLSIHPGRAAEPATEQQITKPEGRTSISADARFFTGRALVEPLFTATRELSVTGAYVTFEPGARSGWHTHPAGQRLVVTAGVGRTQEWGKPVREIRAGDVVVCPPGVKHWHGASQDGAMTHLAITGSVEGKTVDWLEKVTEEQYAGK